MLLSLHIEDYALIDRLEVEFAPGLNVLTGETGSGKSIVVDALGLLLGERADAAAVRSGAERAWVSGVFALDRGSLAASEASEGLDLEAGGGNEAMLVVRREIGGRGRVVVNDRPATVAALRQLAPALGDVQTQNQALAGFTPAAQLALLDAFAGGGQDAPAKLAAAHRAWRERDGAAAAWEHDENLRGQQADLWRYQQRELAAARLRDGEDLELEHERARLANAERIAAAAQAAYAALYDAPEAAAASVKAAAKAIEELARYDARAGELLPRLSAARAELADLAASLRLWLEPDEASPARLAAIEDRLVVLDRLKRKYGPTLAEALALAAELERRLTGLDDAAGERSRLRAAADAAAADYREAACRRSAERRAAAAALAAEVARQAGDLAMQVRLEVEFDVAEGAVPPREVWGARGWDRIRLLAATNAGEPLKPLAEIASGGELSRLLLALQVAIENRVPAAAGASPRTLVFDEIDAGIGGRAAEAVGRKLRQLGGGFQVLCVTHLAQIASCAGRHLRVEKAPSRGRAVTRVAVLEGAERVEEVARMLGGQTSAVARRHAAELLARHQSA